MLYAQNKCLMPEFTSKTANFRITVTLTLIVFAKTIMYSLDMFYPLIWLPVTTSLMLPVLIVILIITYDQTSLIPDGEAGLVAVEVLIALVLTII